MSQHQLIQASELALVKFADRF